MLLKQRAISKNPSAKRAIERVVEGALRRTNAFQTFTAISPISQLCELLESLNERDQSSKSLDCVVPFLEESLARFARQPYGYFDKAAALVNYDSARLDKLSCILITMMHQWRYMVEKERNSQRLSRISQWLLEFLARLAIIGEESTAIELELDDILQSGSIALPSDFSTMLKDLRQWSLLLYGSSSLRDETLQML